MIDRWRRRRGKLPLSFVFGSQVDCRIRKNGHFSSDSFYCNSFISFVDRHSYSACHWYHTRKYLVSTQFRRLAFTLSFIYLLSFVYYSLWEYGLEVAVGFYADRSSALAHTLVPVSHSEYPIQSIFISGHIQIYWWGWAYCVLCSVSMIFSVSVFFLSKRAIGAHDDNFACNIYAERKHRTHLSVALRHSLKRTLVAPFSSWRIRTCQNVSSKCAFEYYKACSSRE